MIELEVLIIDDSEIDRLIATQVVLNYLGVQSVNSVASGQEALNMLKDKEAKVKGLLLLDIRMPEMDGFAFLEGFDKLPQHVKSCYQIFMLSSSIDPMDIQKARESSYVVDYLQKPLTKETICRLKEKIAKPYEIEK